MTISGQTTTTQFAYEGLLLMGLSATQTGGATNDNWRITYLYDENGRPYAGVYRQPNTSTEPVVFGMTTTDRGDVVSLLDSAGNPFAAYRYDAWGNPQGSGNLGTGIWTQSTGLISQAVADAIAIRQPLRYAGYCYDSESGLYYLSARHYDPKTAQFISKDPIKSDELSPYQYCGGDPVNRADPSGAWWGWLKKIGKAFKWLGGRIEAGWQWIRSKRPEASRRTRIRSGGGSLIIVGVATGGLGGWALVLVGMYVSKGHNTGDWSQPYEGD